jgi:predicted nucleic acid-binding protein
VSETQRPRPDPAVVSWLEGTSSRELHVSVLTLGEVRRGVELLRARDPGRAGAYADWLQTLRESFEDRILDVDDAVAQAWGRLNAASPVPAVDGLLAATALVHGLVVVTRDGGPFERCGVPFVDPWAN